MKKKAILLIIAVAVFGCSPDHTHEWGAWQSNATQHWKECTANDGAEYGRANHTGNPCNVCGYEEIPTVPQPTIIDNTNGLAFDGKVTIKTSDLYTAAEWNAVVANVITALNAAYEEGPPPAQTQFITVFSNTLDSDGRGNGEIVLVNNLTNNWEVKDGEFMTVYLKTGSIATADYKTLIQRMLAKVPDIGKATLPKDRAFLATVSDTKIGSYALGSVAI